MERELVKQARAANKPAPRRPQLQDPRTSPNTPGNLYNGMIAPLAPVCAAWRDLVPRGVEYGRAEYLWFTTADDDRQLAAGLERGGFPLPLRAVA